MPASLSPRDWYWSVSQGLSDGAYLHIEREVAVAAGGPESVGHGEAQKCGIAGHGPAACERWRDVVTDDLSWVHCVVADDASVVLVCFLENIDSAYARLRRGNRVDAEPVVALGISAVECSGDSGDGRVRVFWANRRGGSSAG